MDEVVLDDVICGVWVRWRRTIGRCECHWRVRFGTLLWSISGLGVDWLGVGAGLGLRGSVVGIWGVLKGKEGASGFGAAFASTRGEAVFSR